MTERDDGAERPNLEILPKALTLMKFHSHEIPNGVLFVLKVSEQIKYTEIRKRLEGELGNGVSGSTLSHLLIKLVNEDLLKKDTEYYKLTSLACASKVAFLEFLAFIAEPVRSRIIQQYRDYGIQIDQTLERNVKDLDVNPLKQFPVEMKIVRALSDEARLRVLLGLRAAGPIPNRVLKNAIGLPASTLSNLATDLNRVYLVERIHGEYELTDVGRRILEGFFKYQETMREPITSSVLRTLEKDLGLPPGSLKSK